MIRFIVMEASAQVPSSWKWRGGPKGYRKIAVVELNELYAFYGSRPKQISNRARGVVRIVRIWDRLFEGTTENCEYRRALREAWVMAGELNAQKGGDSNG